MKKIIQKSALIAIVALVFLFATIAFLPVNNEVSHGFNYDYVYLGGMPIGISARANGLIVSDFIDIMSSSGEMISPARQAGIKRGDIINTVNGKTISDANALNEAIKNAKVPVVISVIRGGTEQLYTVKPIYDSKQKSQKIGMAVKNDLNGVGTMTFMTEDGQFASLGHRIADSFGHGEIYQSGKAFWCDIRDYVRGKEGKAGELHGIISYGKGSIGTITANKFCGVYGDLNDDFNCENFEKIKVGGQNTAQPGKAKIRTTINGSNPEYYEIEIIKASKQNSPAEKGMVIRVTDDRLLEKTGGILQGMSGSPIIQNNMLVGAVTHVFLNDPTKGYGIYVDWMSND